MLWQGHNSDDKPLLLEVNLHDRAEEVELVEKEEEEEVSMGGGSAGEQLMWRQSL